MNAGGSDGRPPAHLELLLCSSEDDNFPAANLARGCYMPHPPREVDRDQVDGRRLTPTGWESEKFCEYPQELVFRVNRGLPTRIDQVNLLSHHCKVSTRIEIFTAVTADDGSHARVSGVSFERLGFVRFQSNEATKFSSRELQAVTLPRSIAKVTLLRLVLHACHQTKANVFSQVGLISVAVYGPQASASLKLPYLRTPVETHPKEVGHLFSSSLSPLRAKYEWAEQLGCSRSDTVRKHEFFPRRDYAASPLPRALSNESPLSFAVWIPDTREHKTVEQICAQIQIGKQLALFADDPKLMQHWITLDREASYLSSLLERRVSIPNDGDQIMARCHNSEDDGLEVLIPHFVELERRRRSEDMKMHQEMLSSLGPYAAQNHKDPFMSKLPANSSYVTSNLETLGPEQWQEREAVLWKIVASAQPDSHLWSNTSESRPVREFVTVEGKGAVEMLAIGLGDVHPQVFIAACALLQVLLITLPRFQNPSASRSDIARIVELVVARLDDHNAQVRNKATFSIMKIAGSARVRGTFVTHLLLKHVEQKDFQPSDQRLLALFKLLSGLLVSFHCCASIDIAPKRVIRFLQRSDADLHENALIREAAEQLTIVLSCEVGVPFVLEHYVNMLPVGQQCRYALLFQHTEGQKRRLSASEDS